MSCSAHTEITLVETQNIAVPEMAQTLEKEMKCKFTSTDLKSLTQINTCFTCKQIWLKKL